MAANPTFARLLDCGHRGHVPPGEQTGWCPIDRTMVPALAEDEASPLELGTRLALRYLRRSSRHP
ncbi:MAG TPA: hypothetical protein VFH38_07555 [Jatrophihabitans sp.]|nr:hypothetical protein [Jatrophihabitans sp.]